MSQLKVDSSRSLLFKMASYGQGTQTYLGKFPVKCTILPVPLSVLITTPAGCQRLSYRRCPETFRKVRVTDESTETITATFMELIGWL